MRDIEGAVKENEGVGCRVEVSQNSAIGVKFLKDIVMFHYHLKYIPNEDQKLNQRGLR